MRHPQKKSLPELSIANEIEQEKTRPPIVVPDLLPAELHPVTKRALAALAEEVKSRRQFDATLGSPGRRREKLPEVQSFRVATKDVPRATLIFNTLCLAFEERGWRPRWQGKYLAKQLWITVGGLDYIAELFDHGRHDEDNPGFSSPSLRRYPTHRLSLQIRRDIQATPCAPIHETKARPLKRRLNEFTLLILDRLRSRVRYDEAIKRRAIEEEEVRRKWEADRPAREAAEAAAREKRYAEEKERLRLAALAKVDRVRRRRLLREARLSREVEMARAYVAEVERRGVRSPEWIAQARTDLIAMDPTTPK